MHIFSFEFMDNDFKKLQYFSVDGINCLERFAREIGIPSTLRELGATEDMLPQIAKSSYEGGGYKYMTHDDILNVLKKCYWYNQINGGH